MVTTEITPQLVLAKLLELQETQKKSLHGHDDVGVDTLGLIFNTSTHIVMDNLKELEEIGELTVFKKNLYGENRGRVPLWFVKLTSIFILSILHQQLPLSLII